MGKLSLLVSMLMVSCWAVEIHEVDDVDTAWQKYLAEFPIEIQTKSELWFRKSLFSETHDNIAKHNANKDATFQMGHNQFSVMTEEEKQQFFGALLPVPPGNISRHASSRQVATAVDYRTHACMSAVRNQGGCGSCWAFSATAVVEFQKCSKSGRIRVDLSEQQLVDCSRANGCAGGWEHDAWQYLASNGGQDLESRYPYTARAATCTFQNANSPGAQISSTRPVQWIASGDTNTMMSVLTGGRILSIYMQLPNSFMNYRTGVFNDATCVPNNAHAMNIVGYGSLIDVPYWVVRNSWSSAWGASGYVLVRRGVDLCMIESYARTTNVL
ncbi:zingipain-2 [Daphnia magna]|uniref:Uncharacterized protein n=2 Tax=Daphnia magna TaxID=35525 RepID=A0ABQ9ZM31_9CRUS|nr:zingipain-2 [Daphnia magna]XP_045036353.1 zingipain-2 [Daphnia magna]KAK4014000.1 hypothetical protein OUZ56_026548 [Daphnia magna]KZS06205.1 Uncharacterized protein APZ42_030378 [Daphnia magna]